MHSQVVGVDIDAATVTQAAQALSLAGLSADLRHGDILEQSPPGTLAPTLEPFDAVVGNPPFVRFHLHSPDQRRSLMAAAERQGVDLSGLPSSWAAILIHAASFLKPTGRLAMVMPSELLTADYAAPVRRWLRQRFSAVRIVAFETLQFSDALENVILLIAEGQGVSDAFSVYHVKDADELRELTPFHERAVAVSDTVKWDRLLIPAEHAQALAVVADRFESLGDNFRVSIGTVTGANAFFLLSEVTRMHWGLEPMRDVVPVMPPKVSIDGWRLDDGLWRSLNAAGRPVWLFAPEPGEPSANAREYIRQAPEAVQAGYKASRRPEWWRPILASPARLLLTYMSHEAPRVLDNQRGLAYVNNLHGLLPKSSTQPDALAVLPLAWLNTATLLSAELNGRSYGGGVLKLEPNDARSVQVPSFGLLGDRAAKLRSLDMRLREGARIPIDQVVTQVDRIVLSDQSLGDIQTMRKALDAARKRRLGRRATRIGSRQSCRASARLA